MKKISSDANAWRNEKCGTSLFCFDKMDLLRISDEINPARSIAAISQKRHMSNGFAGISFCMGKRRPKDINVVDADALLSHLAANFFRPPHRGDFCVARLAHLGKRESFSVETPKTAPLPNPLPAGGARGLVLHSLAIAVMQGKLGRYFALRLVRLEEARI